MTVQLHIEGAKIVFDPPFRALRDVILTLVSEIVTSAQGLPRVSPRMYCNMLLIPFCYVHVPSGEAKHSNILCYANLQLS